MYEVKLKPNLYTIELDAYLNRNPLKEKTDKQIAARLYYLKNKPK